MYLAQTRAWPFIKQCLSDGTPVALLYVVESDGSSPGRVGFAMATNNSECTGTIGGGIMEQKLVELSRSLLAEEIITPRLITQYHDKEHASDQSGMICSGMQRVAIIPLASTDIDTITRCLDAIDGEMQGQLELSPTGIAFHPEPVAEDGFLFQDHTEWEFRSTLGIQPKLHIVGAGHVSLALSELMSRLGFHISVYDDRAELNTLLENRFADETHIIDYAAISSVISGNAKDFLVIMTIGYRTDKIVLKQLIDEPFFYIGMLGSKAKVEKLFSELQEEGLSEARLKKIHAPIGLSIASQTAYEIAVSIAAEIIRVKNSPLKDEARDLL